MPETSGSQDVYKDSSLTRTPVSALFHRLDWRKRAVRPISALAAPYSARSATTRQQWFALAVAIFAIATVSLAWPAAAGLVAYSLLWLMFMGNAILRLAACCLPPPSSPPFVPSETDNQDLPTYSVIVALYHEAPLVPQLLQAMLRLDYPHERMEILFALEADDTETIAAFRAQALPPHVHIVEVPEGLPRTKPRALNYALALSHGDLCVIYDAEDAPDPQQLRAAAHAFATGHLELACVQAPLRPVGGETFISRQFAAEYAVQFEILLPALSRLGLPFPLGGTSNHFRTEVLRAIGAWDAHNVTEDADLGLRLAQYGYKTGMITPPTCETPPNYSRAWIPQRTRWIKGYLQTCLVHTRLNTRLRLRVWTGLFLGVFLSAGAAICYAPFSALVVMTLLMSALQHIAHAGTPVPYLPIQDLILFLTGGLSAVLTLVVGARRTGLRFGVADLVCAPVYWCLQSVAACFAVYQLIVKPFHWDKTDHAPVEPAVTQPVEAPTPYKALAAE